MKLGTSWQGLSLRWAWPWTVRARAMDVEVASLLYGFTFRSVFFGVMRHGGAR